MERAVSTVVASTTNKVVLSENEVEDSITLETTQDGCGCRGTMGEGSSEITTRRIPVAVAVVGVSHATV